jgi:hypothetical protein
MKVGDLVRLTYPGAENTGLVVEMWTPHEQTDELPIIMWATDSYNAGAYYPPDHEFLELVAES